MGQMETDILLSTAGRKGRFLYLTKFASRERTENKERNGDMENGNTRFCYVLVSQRSFFFLLLSSITRNCPETIRLLEIFSE